MDINVTVLIVGMNKAKCVNTTQITLCSKNVRLFYYLNNSVKN